MKLHDRVSSLPHLHSLQIQRLIDLDEYDPAQDGSLVRSLLQMYLELGQEFMAEMNAHLQAENFNGLNRSAHTLRSSSANIGAMKLNTLCLELERKTSKGLSHRKDVVSEGTADVRNEFQAVCSEIARVLESIAA